MQFSLDQAESVRALRVAVAAALLAMPVAAFAEPVRLILDTDYRTDVDDPATLAMLHGLQDLGRVDLVGIIATTASSSVVGAIDAVNTYYSRPNIPIGVISSALATGGMDEYAPVLANTSLFPSDQTTATAPNSTSLYRTLLNAAPDNSVKILVVGGQNAIYDLMQTAANHNSDGIGLSGLELIQSKVSELVVMGGNYISATSTENNILRGVTAAQQVAASWPTPVVYAGWELGQGVKTGAALTNPAVNPVAKAFEVSSVDTGGVGVIGDRDSWDQTAALYAVEGLAYYEHPTYTLSAPHEISFDAAGRTIKTPSPTADRYYLAKTMSNTGLATIISDLMTGPPYTIPEPPPPPKTPVMRAPYAADSGTIALFHFDEVAGSSDPGNPIVNHGNGGTSLNLTNTGGPDGRDNTGGGGYGAPGHIGLGSAFDVLASGNGNYYTTKNTAGGGLLTAAVPQSALQGADGAFTYEAIVKLSDISPEQNIIAHDGPNGSRGFLFRVTGGKVSLYTGVGELTALIPTAADDDHAFMAGEWFHVAVAYTGEAGAADNLKFYWTALDSDATEANLIGSGLLTGDLVASVSNPLGIGTTTRDAFRFGSGIVDEVRISSIARGADEFMFVVPEPASMVLLGMGALMLIRRRR